MRILFQNAPDFITYRKFIFLYFKGKIFNHFQVMLVVVLAVKCKRRRDSHRIKKQCSSGNSSVSTSGGNCSTASVGRQNSHHGHLHSHLSHQHYGTAQRRPSSHQQFSTANGRIPHFSDEFESNGILPVGSVTHHHLDAQVTTYFDSL